MITAGLHVSCAHCSVSYDKKTKQDNGAGATLNIASVEASQSFKLPKVPLVQCFPVFQNDNNYILSLLVSLHLAASKCHLGRFRVAARLCQVQPPAHPHPTCPWPCSPQTGSGTESLQTPGILARNPKQKVRKVKTHFSLFSKPPLPSQTMT